MKIKFLMVLLALACGVWGQFDDTIYISPYATGDGTGTDWTNAKTTIPATNTILYGRLYLLSDGIHSNYKSQISLYPTINVAKPTDSCVIRKATVESHGTDIGWHDSLGDGYARIPRLQINSPYITIDGVTGGGPNNWESGHGIWISVDSALGTAYITTYRKTGNPTASDTSTGHHLTIRHVRMGPVSESFWGCGNSNSQTGVYTSYKNTNDILISHCYIHDMSNVGCTFSYVDSNITIEYTRMSRIALSGYCELNSENNHGIGIELYGTKNFVFRYNNMSNSSGSGWIGQYKPAGTGRLSNAKIYGNIFYVTFGANGWAPGVFYNTSNADSVENIKIYNNTFLV